MQRKAGLVIRRVLGGKMIQQQKKIEVVKSPCRDSSPEAAARSFDNPLRFHNFGDFSKRCFHCFASL